jgi:hypothetical protein
MLVGSPALGSERLAQERFSRRHVTFRTEPEVDRIALAINGAVQADPPVAHLHIRLVDAPRAAGFARITGPTFLELRHIALDPAHDGRMCDVQSAFHHYFDKFPIRALVAAISAHTENDEFAFNVSTFEQFVQIPKLLRHPASPRLKPLL